MKHLIALLFLSWMVFPTETDKKEPRFNPDNSSWEPARQSDQLKFNPHSQKWTYERQGSQLKFNPYTQEWYYD
jgi:hypothetical protein